MGSKEISNNTTSLRNTKGHSTSALDMLKCHGIRHQLASHLKGVAIGGIVLGGDKGVC